MYLTIIAICVFTFHLGVKSSSVISADDCTSPFHHHTETATTPSTFIAEFFLQHENIALSLTYLLICFLTYVDACLYSWQCDSETMPFSQDFGHNEAQNETQLPLRSVF